MPYIKTNWVDYTESTDGTPVNAQNLNKIENAIGAIVDYIESTNTPQANALKEQINMICEEFNG